MSLPNNLNELRRLIHNNIKSYPLRGVVEVTYNSSMCGNCVTRERIANDFRALNFTFQFEKTEKTRKHTCWLCLNVRQCIPAKFNRETYWVGTECAHKTVLKQNLISAIQSSDGNEIMDCCDKIQCFNSKQKRMYKPISQFTPGYTGDSDDCDDRDNDEDDCNDSDYEDDSNDRENEDDGNDKS